MKLYIIQGYEYESQYVSYVSEDKEECLRLAKELAAKHKKEREKAGEELPWPYRYSYWFGVLEVETDKLYFPACGGHLDCTKKIWDEHDDSFAYEAIMKMAKEAKKPDDSKIVKRGPGYYTGGKGKK